ncbi:MAG: GGDEF domain-containing protein [Algiphilus sp.]
MHDNVRPSAFNRESLGRLSVQERIELAAYITAFGVYHLDQGGRIRSWNPGAERLTGFSARDVLGAPFAQLFGREAIERKQPEQVLSFCRAHQRVREEQWRIRADGQAFLADVSMELARNERDGEILAFVEVFEDITARKEREDALYRQATRDALTGVANRGHFTEVANKEIDRAKRFSEPLSVALLDIDHFKHVNDTYGHAAGDTALKSFTAAVEGDIRAIDLMGRIGGEEFALLLPRASATAAAEMLQRTRQVVSALRVSTDDGRVFGFTVSGGVAELRDRSTNLATLLRQADAALYRAKREGRNQIIVWKDLEDVLRSRR